MLEELLTEVETFPESVKESLRWFTGIYYVEFNSALRNNLPLSTEYLNHLRNLDYAFNSVSPTTEPIVVYKGKSSNKIYNDKSFISTSLNSVRALDFAGGDCCIMKITVSPGSKIIPIYTISNYPHEEEIILDRDGLLFKTDEYIPEDSVTTILDVTYMPGNSEPL